MRRGALVLVGIGLTLGTPVWGAHVTDKLAVGLYASANDAKPARVLVSGTPLEVLDRGGRLCRVRLGDGDTGWLECRYVTDEKPARAMLVEAQALAGRLRGEIGERDRRIETLEAALAAAPAPAGLATVNEGRNEQSGAGLQESWLATLLAGIAVGALGAWILLRGRLRL